MNEFRFKTNENSNHVQSVDQPTSVTLDNFWAIPSSQTIRTKTGAVWSNIAFVFAV